MDYGLAWISDRLTELPHDMLVDGPVILGSLEQGILEHMQLYQK